MRDSNNDINFETALKSLETIVETMEKGDLTLEQSLQNFEDGIILTRQCQQALKVAEHKVKILMETKNDTQYVEFNQES